ncbi:receptor-like cytoplasmic kinase 185 [Selaginella moellendorffii]|uniref:receptor-like cytoplasmic kinase 185 n=1 Tax=Selaginella moellendorffii TaxID=88036 RepID=UPI000D1C20B9|nr:receptor-like cytoplasmic kinase 185 [Selaginella moellendorffii]|eukprot:XP_024521972.1 receptor-like cytoplasmic kinase 185 [Selaginella moellendorffii]
MKIYCRRSEQIIVVVVFAGLIGVLALALDDFPVPRQDHTRRWLLQGVNDTGFSTNAPSVSPTVAAPPGKSPSPGCCVDNMMNRPGGETCSCVYPIEIGLLLDNVSSNFINSTVAFQHQLASQLKLQDPQVVITAFYYITTSELNMSIYLGPLVGVSFSSQEATSVKASLDAHKVRFNSSLVGNYTLLRFNLFGPEPVSPSPSPVFAPSPSRNQPLSTPTNNQSSASERPKGKVRLGIILGVGIAIVALLCLSILFIRKLAPGNKESEEKASLTKSGHTSSFTKASDPPQMLSLLTRPTSTRIFSYEDLKEATNGFDPANLLGEGGFGRVYRGNLKDGMAVAIKRLSSGGHQGDKEFLVEVEMLSRLHHRHLVKLVGFFSSRDSSQHLLCYELVPNGSLESWLHGRLGANNPLDWDTRMKIAIGAARGLAYLHEDCQPCVIHRDFKASNILLEDNFQAKVADFGLAKQAPEGQTSYVSTRVMGTFGYVAPEYAMTGHLLVKSDVYSYGVVLLELLSGRKPVDMAQPTGQENLVTWARPVLKDVDHIYDLADPRLNGQYPREDFAQVAAVAAACVAPETNQRPTMGEVVQSLKMVQHSNEYTHSGERENMTVETPVSPSMSDGTFATSWHNHNTRQTSATFESDGTSSFFSSGPFSGLAALDEGEDAQRGPTMSEDLLEGR